MADPVWVAAWATVGAAVATAGTGVVIALQTVATRRSVQMSRILAVEAVKTRLDGRAPRLSVTFNAPFWPPFQLATHDVTVARGAQLPTGKEFRVPKDYPRLLLVDVWGRVHNYGATAWDVVVRRPLVVWPEELEIRPDRESWTTDEDPAAEAARAGMRRQFLLEVESTVVLQPGEGCGIRFAPQVAVADLFSASVAGTALATGTLIVDDGFDDGVIDTVTVELRGAALSRVIDDDGAVQLTGKSPGGEPPVQVQTAATTREYFVSKSRNEQLSQP